MLQATTLKQRITMWQPVRRWLRADAGAPWPTSAMQIVEYVEERADEPCGWTVPTTVASTLAFLEKAGGIRLEDRLSRDPL